MIGRTSGAVLALVLLAGCGGSAEPGEEPATTAPPKAYTAAQLKAALPGADDVPAGKEETRRCPGDESCIEPDDGVAVSRQFSLELPFTGAAAERAAHDGIPDYLSLTITQNTTEEMAETAFSTERKDQSAYDGSFEQKAEKTGKSFTFGLSGSGTMRDTTISGWPGYYLQRDITLTNPEGGNEGAVKDGQLLIRRGSVTVDVRIGSGQGKRSLAECEEIARQIAEDYLARLG